MEGQLIRQGFVDFFKRHGHHSVRSSSLVPHDDPTLLFANAGMNQFKEIFTGARRADHTRAVSYQKCVRAGGKHNDFEVVGRSSRHHTFFEMLGNFSFGDYFKEEAIELAWELCTGDFGLQPERLWASVFREDETAFALWRDRIGLPEGRIARLGEKDNFWEMGETGPCGPCSEIFVDHGPQVGCGRPECDPGCDCGRFVEFWNLVFMEFEKDASGERRPLPRPSIDTGLGLERMAAILQGVQSNYDTDLFRPILAAVGEELGGEYGGGGEGDVSFRVVADHLRAVTFLVADGVLPANEGRGYVLRKIIRRAVRHGRLLGAEGPFLWRLTGVVAETMAGAYPELRDARSFVSQVVRAEEDRFDSTLARGMRRVAELVEELRGRGEVVIPGEEAFKLYDTFGFPRDLIEEIAGDSGLAVDQQGFGRALARQQERSSAAAQEREARGGRALQLAVGLPPTIFLGYEGTAARDCRVLALFDGEGRPMEELPAGAEGTLLLDRSPFYGEAGGQVGDTGAIEGDECALRVLDVQRDGEEHLLHRVEARQGSVRRGERVDCRVDEERRLAIMANHTSTHLLQAALRSVVGDHVKQAGSLVAPDRLRFDFTHFAPLGPAEVRRIEDLVNRAVRQDLPVATEVRPIEEALAGGAIALFGEKYGNQVRVISVPQVSQELCGGTHCSRTGQIGLFKVLEEHGVAAGVRRVEAVTGPRALVAFQHEQELVEDLCRATKAARPQLLETVERLQGQLRDQGKEIERLRLKLASGSGGGAGAGGEEPLRLAGIPAIIRQVEGLSPAEMRNLSDTLRQRLGSGIVLLAGKGEDKISLLVSVTRDLAGRLDASRVVRELAPIVGGSGGGKAELAQAGGKNPAGLPELLRLAPEVITRLAGG